MVAGLYGLVVVKGVGCSCSEYHVEIGHPVRIPSCEDREQVDLEVECRLDEVPLVFVDGLLIPVACPCSTYSETQSHHGMELIGGGELECRREQVDELSLAEVVGALLRVHPRNDADRPLRAGRVLRLHPVPPSDAQLGRLHGLVHLGHRAFLEGEHKLPLVPAADVHYGVFAVERVPHDAERLLREELLEPRREAHERPVLAVLLLPLRVVGLHGLREKRDVPSPRRYDPRLQRIPALLPVGQARTALALAERAVHRHAEASPEHGVPEPLRADQVPDELHEDPLQGRGLDLREEVAARLRAGGVEIGVVVVVALARKREHGLRVGAGVPRHVHLVAAPQVLEEPEDHRPVQGKPSAFSASA